MFEKAFFIKPYAVLINRYRLLAKCFNKLTFL